MIFELVQTGRLGHWWEYVIFVLCCVILVAGSAFLGLAARFGAFRRFR